MTVTSKNMYIDRLDEIIYKFKETFHRIIKMKAADVHAGTYIDYGVEHNDTDPKFKVGDLVRILKYKIIFANDYTPNWF